MAKARAGGGILFEAFDVDGTPLWSEHVDIGAHRDGNGMTTVFLNYLWDAGVRAQSQLTTWFVLLVDNSGFSAFSASDTAASHPGWSESTAYSESVRQTWTPTAASGGSTTSASTLNFTMNASVTIKGAATVSNSTKGGSSGTLGWTGALSTAQALTSGQVLRLTPTGTLTAS